MLSASPAADSVRRNVDVTLSSGGNVTVLAARSITSSIPIIFASGGDPIGTASVASFSRPSSRAGTRKVMIVALAPKLLIALWRFVTTGETLEGVRHLGNPLLVEDSPVEEKGFELSIPLARESQAADP